MEAGRLAHIPDRDIEECEVSAWHAQTRCLANYSLKPPLPIFTSYSWFKGVLENYKIHHKELFPTEYGDSLCIPKQNQEIQINTDSDLLNRAGKRVEEKAVEISDFETEKALEEAKKGPLAAQSPLCPVDGSICLQL